MHLDAERQRRSALAYDQQALLAKEGRTAGSRYEIGGEYKPPRRPAEASITTGPT